MKKIIVIFFCVIIANNVIAQAVTKYGESKTTSTNFVDKNGKIGSGVLNKNGKILTLPTLTTTVASSVAITTATSGGNITSDGGSVITARGVCWSTSQNPVATGSHTTNGTGTGSFTSSITGLAASTTYYVRAYATNSAGTSYGNQISFATITTPTVTTTAASSVASTTATSGGNVTSDGGATVTARGVCWSTSQNPVATGSHSTDGTGTGSFTSSITGLTASTTYYVRAYATNSAGTSYGNQISYTTLSPCAGITPPAGYGVVSSSGRCWLDRNLGASQVATSSTDAAAYGDLYQWGRLTDGHQIRTSATITTLSTTNTPGNSLFIVGSSDWRSTQNDNLWQGVAGVNNPCPSGYRLPTAAEWNTERASWSSNNAAGAFSSPLKLPVAGNRDYSNGSLYHVGSNGSYWSSSVDGTTSQGLNFHSSNAGMGSRYRADGFSVRCIKD